MKRDTVASSTTQAVRAVSALRQRVVEVGEAHRPDCWIDCLDVGYDGQTFYVRKGIWPPWIIHEFAHWLVATPDERKMVNFGLSDFDCACAEIEARASVVTIGLWFLLGEPDGITWEVVAEELSVTRCLSECLAEAEGALP